MNVSELIKALLEMPQDAEVWQLWDGEPRTVIESVYLSKSGTVITSDFGMGCYSESAMPVDAVVSEGELYWQTPGDSVWRSHDEKG